MNCSLQKKRKEVKKNRRKLISYSLNVKERIYAYQTVILNIKYKKKYQQKIMHEKTSVMIVRAIGTRSMHLQPLKNFFRRSIAS